MQKNTVFFSMMTDVRRKRSGTILQTLTVISVEVLFLPTALKNFGSVSFQIPISARGSSALVFGTTLHFISVGSMNDLLRRPAIYHQLTLEIARVHGVSGWAERTLWSIIHRLYLSSRIIHRNVNPVNVTQSHCCAGSAYFTSYRYLSGFLLDITVHRHA